jgi:hypothetical protein
VNVARRVLTRCIVGCVAGLGLTGMALVVPTAGSASGSVQQEHEPNDSAATANGPLASGTTWAGTLSTRNDSDWFKLFVGSQTQLQIKLMNTTDCSTQSSRCPHTEVLYAFEESNNLRNARFLGLLAGHSHTLSETLSPGTYYFRVVQSRRDPYIRSSMGTYQFSVTSSAPLLRRPKSS